MQMHHFLHVPCSGAARLCVTRLVFMFTQPSLLAPMCETAGVETVSHRFHKAHAYTFFFLSEVEALVVFLFLFLLIRVVRNQH